MEWWRIILLCLVPIVGYIVSTVIFVLLMGSFAWVINKILDMNEKD